MLALKTQKIFKIVNDDAKVPKVSVAKVNVQKKEEKSLQHPVFPGGHPSKY